MYHVWSDHESLDAPVCSEFASSSPTKLSLDELHQQIRCKIVTPALSLSFSGRVLVHCAMGISRSATLVLAFLMICENKTLVDAIQAVCKHRGVCPNSGFLKQLQELDMRLAREKGREADPLRF